MSDFKCPEVVAPVDYLQINDHVTGTPSYLIPRACVEALGVDTSSVPVDRPSSETTGAVWFDREQSAKMRAHRHTYRTTPPEAS